MVMPMLNRLLPMACMALLASCKTAAPMPAPVVPEPVLTPEQLAERQELDQDRLFARSFQDAIRYPMRALSGAHWVGKFEYVFTIDRNNRLVSCALGPTTRAETQALPYNPELARAMAPLCWTIVLAELAARRFGDKAQATIVAPIVVNLEQEAGSMA